MFRTMQYDANVEFWDQYKKSMEETHEKVYQKLKSTENNFKNKKRSENKEFEGIPYAWDKLTVDCPICSSNAIMNGYVEHDCNGYDIDKRFNWLLYFYAEDFYCPICELKLDDFDELEMANIEANIDIYEHIDDYFPCVYFA